MKGAGRDDVLAKLHNKYSEKLTKTIDLMLKQMDDEPLTEQEEFILNTLPANFLATVATFLKNNEVTMDTASIDELKEREDAIKRKRKRGSEMLRIMPTADIAASE